MTTHSQTLQSITIHKANITFPDKWDTAKLLIYMPNLKSYYLHLDYGQRRGFNPRWSLLRHFLPFTATVKNTTISDSRPKHVWSLGVDITVMFFDESYLEIGHADKVLKSSLREDSNEILQGVTSPLSILALNWIELGSPPPNLPYPGSLHTLILNYIVDFAFRRYGRLEEWISTFDNLKVLTLHPSYRAEIGMDQFPPSVTNLTLVSTLQTLHSGPARAIKRLDNLWISGYLEGSGLDGYYNAKNIGIKIEYPSRSVVKSLLRMTDARRIYYSFDKNTWPVTDAEAESIKGLLKELGVKGDDGKWTDFILERNETTDRWGGRVVRDVEERKALKDTVISSGAQWRQVSTGWSRMSLALIADTSRMRLNRYGSIFEQKNSI